MFAYQPLHSRKRPSRDWDQEQVQDKGDSKCKKQKRVDKTPLQPSSPYWDNLSKIHLTRTALRELHRRHPARPQGQAASPKSGRPITRSLAPFDTSPPRLVLADIYTQNCSPRTASDLRRFARQGGPNMSDERGHPRPAVASRSRPARGPRQPTSQSPRQNPTPTSSDHLSAETSSTRNTGPYDRNFQQLLIDNKVFPPGYRYPDGRTPPKPANWKEINERLRCRRRSLSSSAFTEEDFENFQRVDNGAVKEKQVSTFVLPIIEGTIGDAKCTAGGIPFRNLTPLTDGTIVPGNPDIYYGARPEQLDRQVRKQLSNIIEPSTQDDLPIVPNFFVAAKGPDGSLAVALRQASYDGALGARGIHNLQSYRQAQSMASDRASTITSIYHGGQLKLYTSHRKEPIGPGSKPEYYMHQLNTWGMTGNAESFRQGATAYRNARDWAEEQRNAAIEAANIVISGQSADIGHTTPTASTQVESETSRLELAEDSWSPGSTQYTTPPSGERTFKANLEIERPGDLDTNKRGRQHLQGSSPLQQKKRHRQEQLDNSPLRESTTAAIAMSTGLSYRLEDHGLDPEEDDLDDKTEVLSSDEEADDDATQQE